VKALASVAVLAVLVAVLVGSVLVARRVWPLGPGVRFQRRHLGRVETVPGGAAQVSEHFRARCPCGWEGPVRDTQLMAAGDQQDHVLSAWHASRAAPPR